MFIFATRTINKLKQSDLDQMAGNLKVIQKIRSSFTKQLTIWVAGGVVVITAVVIFLLGRFAQQVILEESVEMRIAPSASAKQ